MSDYAWGLTVIAVIDAILFIVGRIIYSSRVAQSSKGIPLIFSVLIVMGAFFVHGMGIVIAGALNYDPNAPMTRWIFLSFSILTASPAALVYAGLIMQSSAALGVAMVMGEERDAEESTDNNKALLLLKEGKVEEAIAEYQLQASMFPDDAAPLCGLAGLLEHQNRLEDAAEVWVQVRDRHVDDGMAVKKAKARLNAIGRQLGDERDGLATEGLAPDANFDYDAEDALPAGEGEAPRRNEPTVPRDMETAHRLARQVDTDEAVRVYRNYFRSMKQSTAQPLFAAVSRLENDERYEDAKSLLQEIGHTFKEDQRTWAKAMFNLAVLFEKKLHDISAAQYILKQIQTTMPGTEQCYMAGEQLQEMGE
jgi:tetratricopeptide (TPR) repeat protein